MQHNFAKSYCYWHFEVDFLKQFVDLKTSVTAKRIIDFDRFFANATFIDFAWDLKFDLFGVE